MCDYSLQHVANRPAKVGDKLVSSQFVNSITRGFAAVGEPNVAVCLLPGTELVFDRDVECDHALGFFPNKKLRENVARFRQINLDSPHEHHDALECRATIWMRRGGGNQSLKAAAGSEVMIDLSR
jgi:hypothetical protein